MADVPTVLADVKADLAKAVAEYGFVKLYWTRLSIIVVGAAGIGFLVGFVL